MQNSEKNHIEYFLCSFKHGMHIICGAVAAIVLHNTLKIVLYTFQISLGLLRINILPQVHFCLVFCPFTQRDLQFACTIDIIYFVNSKIKAIV